MGYFNISISFNKWPDNIFGGAVIAGIVVVAKDITWDVTSGSLLGIAIGESVILGHWCSHFHRNTGPNNHSAQLSNASANSPLDVWSPAILHRMKWNSKPPSPQIKDGAVQQPKPVFLTEGMLNGSSISLLSILSWWTNNSAGELQMRNRKGFQRCYTRFCKEERTVHPSFFIK